MRVNNCSTCPLLLRLSYCILEIYEKQPLFSILNYTTNNNHNNQFDIIMPLLSNNNIKLWYDNHTVTQRNYIIFCLIFRNYSYNFLSSARIVCHSYLDLLVDVSKLHVQFKLFFRKSSTRSKCTLSEDRIIIRRCTRLVGSHKNDNFPWESYVTETFWLVQGGA